MYFADMTSQNSKAFQFTKDLISADKTKQTNHLSVVYCNVQPRREILCLSLTTLSWWNRQIRADRMYQYAAHTQ